MVNINIIIALAPVVGLLTAFLLMDRFKLVRPLSILAALTAGAVAALLSLWMNEWLLRVHHVPPSMVSRYIAPITEETAKALFLVVLIVTGRVGFPVDAAVQGFSVGTGFALIENLSYLRLCPAPRPWSGSCAVSARRCSRRDDDDLRHDLEDDRRSASWTMDADVRPRMGGGRRDSFGVQSSPAAAARRTLLLLIGLPLLVLWVFDRSERATGEWVGMGMDLDIGS